MVYPMIICAALPHISIAIISPLDRSNGNYLRYARFLDS
jgi:hypothetical protein